MKGRIEKTEHGYAIVLNESTAKTLGLVPGSEVELRVEDGSLVVSLPDRNIDPTGDGTDFDEAVERVLHRYDDVFKRLAE